MIVPTATGEVAKKTIFVGETKIQVEIASTAESRAKGLSGRTDLLNDSGMLFIFDSKDVSPIFWMKDTLIPLDIIWIKDRSVVKIDKNVEPANPDTPDSELKLYYPGKPIDYVLEVKSGYSDAHGILVGSKVDLSSL